MDKPLVMGILNLTPDSFFDGGRYLDSDAWLAQTEKMIGEGAAIIDIGAVSSRPGAKSVSEEEELSRLIPVLSVLVKRFPTTIFSVDTFRAKVAKQSADAGAGIINDISGGGMDFQMLETVANTGLPYILMHMQGKPENMQNNPSYTDVIAEVNLFFEKSIQTLNQKGIREVILDPGFGFGKTIPHNYSLLQNLGSLKQPGYPLLVGISRKSMIYKLLEISPDESLNATSALQLIAILKGASILRVHDVKEAVQIIKVAGMLR